MHGRIPEISQKQRQHIQQDNIKIVILQVLGLFKGLLDFLLNKEVDLVEVLEEGFVETRFDFEDGMVNLFEEAVEPYAAG